MTNPIKVADWLHGFEYRAPPEPPPSAIADAELAAKAARVDALRRKVPKRFLWAFDAKGTVLLTRAKGAPLAPAFGLRSVTVGGLAGVGKTSLAVWMLRQLLDAPDAPAPKDIEVISAYRLGTARIQHRAGDGEPAIVEAAMRASLLLLDDLGSERDTQNNAIPDIIFGRHDDDLPTWITTGLSSEQIRARYGDGVSRRVFEGALTIKLGAAS